MISRTASARGVERLARLFKDIPIHREEYYLLSYGFDATGLRGKAAAVAFPGSLEDLAGLVREAAKLALAVVPRGAGSGFSGGSVPTPGALVVSTERLRRILRFDPERAEVEVECGVVNRELQDYLEPLGFFYPPDPASMNFSTIGGNIAENAGGPRAFRHGVTRRYVRSITWVTAAGEICTTPAAGAAALLVGGEGTLGIVYSARLAVAPLPEAYRTSLVEMAPGAGAMRFASTLISAGLEPSVLEYIDSKTILCVGEYCAIDCMAANADFLFIELDGRRGDVESRSKLLDEAASRAGARVRTARDADERELLWKVRRSVSPSLARRGVTKVNEDVSLPLGRLEEGVRAIHALADELRLDCYLFGHAGDGNIHVNIMTDRRRREEMKRVEEFVERLFERVVSMGGTLSGEHGIGLTKSRYLRLVFSPAEIETERAVKRAMDPAGTLNPGKYFMEGGSAA